MSESFIKIADDDTGYFLNQFCIPSESEECCYPWGTHSWQDREAGKGYYQWLGDKEIVGLAAS